MRTGSAWKSFVPRKVFVTGLLGALVGFVATASDNAVAELYVNEIFWDTGGSSEGGGHLAGDDERDEYIELRGTPETSLANHYLIFLENENEDFTDDSSGNIEGLFDFNIADGGGVASIGSNGFLTLRQKGNLYDSFYGGVAAGTTDLVNAGTGTDSQGWGNNYTTSGSSTVGFSWDTADGRNQIENSGFTAMLIDIGEGPVPTIGMELDGHFDNDNDPNTHRDGLDNPTGQPGWTIVDSIGVHAEGSEPIFGRTYAQINFGTLKIGEDLGGGIPFVPNIEPEAEYIGIEWSGKEIEYLARWGDSTSQTGDAWHASNVTQRSVAGAATGAPDYRQSGDPHPACEGCALPPNFELESTKGVPYGTPLLDTLGESNLFIAPAGVPGDYNGNGTVDAADYAVWRDNVGALGTPGTVPGDGTTTGDTLGTPDGTVDEWDFAFWRSRFGATSGSGSGAGAATAVPEPASVALAVVGALALAGLARRRG